MMDKIENIYLEAYTQSVAAEEGRRKLDKKLKESLSYIPDYKVLTTEQIEDLAFDGGSVGHEQGFAEGFRYAITLMVECLMC